ncbi:flagellar hook-length control protein FliK [bacterium]|nr:MAG: flagellar hook-length control protein FliK [bacterium]RIK62802.1 MAG: hypothetical protein DCC64_09600 [Planctomycetota bacterium]
MTASITPAGPQQAPASRRAATEAGLKFDRLLGALLGEMSVPIERQAPAAPQAPLPDSQSERPARPEDRDEVPESPDEMPEEAAALPAAALAPAPADHPENEALPPEARPSAAPAAMDTAAPEETQTPTGLPWPPEGELVAPQPRTGTFEQAAPPNQPQAAAQDDPARQSLPQPLKAPEAAPLEAAPTEVVGQRAGEGAYDEAVPPSPQEPFVEPSLSPAEDHAAVLEPSEPASPAQPVSAARTPQESPTPALPVEVSKEPQAQTGQTVSEPEVRPADTATKAEPEPQDTAQGEARPESYLPSPVQESDDTAFGPRLEKPAPEATSVKPLPEVLSPLPGAPQTPAQTPARAATGQPAQEAPTEPVVPASAPSREGRVRGRRFAEVRAENLGLRQVEVIQRFARQFALRQTEGETEARLLLSPPTLGSVKLTLRMEDGVLTGSALAETAAARHLLQTHLPELQAALADQGLTLGRFDVSSDSGQESPRENGSSRPRPSPGEIEAEAPARMAARVVAGRVEGYL